MITMTYVTYLLPLRNDQPRVVVTPFPHSSQVALAVAVVAIGAVVALKVR